MKTHDFTVCIGETVDDRGETHWPDFLKLEFKSRYDDFIAIESLLDQLRYQKPKGKNGRFTRCLIAGNLKKNTRMNETN